MASDDTPRPVGSVAEETARLLDALLGAEGPAGSGAAATHTRSEDSQPEGTTPCPTCGHTQGSAEVCHLCPVCQLLRVVRAVRPETLDRLADLAGAVTETLRDAAANRWRETGGEAARPERPTVQEIVVTDERSADEAEGAR